MDYQYLTVATVNEITLVTLNRPQKRNALHQPMIQELLSLVALLHQNDSRLVILQGEGEHFCAGADLASMQKLGEENTDDNFADAQSLANLLYQLYTLPKPLLVLVHGSVLGAGMGLVAVADIAIASKSTSFGFPELSIGIAPSIVSPYIGRMMGDRAATYYFLTAERFGAVEAHRLQLIQRVTEDDALMSVGISMAHTILQQNKKAIAETKQLIRRIATLPINEMLVQETAEHLARMRSHVEAQEGMRAFLEKRKPSWR